MVGRLFSMLYGVPSITGEAPRVTNAIFELDTCIESALRLIMAFDNDNKEMSSKKPVYNPYIKCVRDYLMQQKILLRDSLSGCEAINDKEYIQITYDPNELNFSPEVLGSLYFLRALYKNEY